MKHYELTYLISPDLSEQEANSLSLKIASFFLAPEKQRILEKNLSLLKKHLSYTIKKKTAAYLATLNFEMKPEMLEGLKKQIKSEPKILRYLIILSKPTPEIVKKAATKSAKGKKVELEEIEKKLEEILRE